MHMPIDKERKNSWWGGCGVPNKLKVIKGDSCGLKDCPRFFR
jgi:hypothetical protein